MGRATNTADQYRSAPLQVLGSTSAGRVICGMDLAECVSVPGNFLHASGGLPPRLLPPWEGVIAPNKGNADRAVGIFGNAGRVWAPALCPDPPKKALCHTYPLGGVSNKYCRSVSVLSEQYETSYLFYVTLSFLCNIICYLISVFVFSLVTLSGATTISHVMTEILFTNPSARAGYDTRSIFKRSLTGLNSEFSFS